jgi:hypothetical protein
MLREGQVLRTGHGRAELLLGSGVFLRLGDQSAVRMLDTRLEDTQVELQQGTALIEVVDMARDSDVHIVVGPTRTGFKGSGLYRFEAGPNELRVFGGQAEVFSGGQEVVAPRGRAVHLGDALIVSKFDRRKNDALHEWAARRSFFLFSSNPEAHGRQTNWEVNRVTRGENKPGMTSDQDITFLSNRDFGVTFYSQASARAFGMIASP